MKCWQVVDTSRFQQCVLVEEHSRTLAEELAKAELAGRMAPAVRVQMVDLVLVEICGVLLGKEALASVRSSE